MPGIQNIIKSLSSGCRLRAKDELQNAKMRVGLGLVITAYLFISNQYTPDDTFSEFALFCISFYLAVALLLFFWTTRSAAKYPLRPVVGVTLDLGIGTALMITGGAGTAWLYVGFLWTIIASGFRFGRPYLLIATILAVIGFSLVLRYSSFWQANIVMGIGMLAWLMVLPLYIAKLLYNLELAIKNADVANQAKSRFLANMSHEIRTPLTAIIGYAESALDSDQDMQQQAHALSVIQRSGDHLLTIINEILDFSKVEADEMDIESISINPFLILADVEAIAATQAIKKGLSFDVDYQWPLPASITSDQVRLKQILLNLCSNAIKFTQQGSITIRIRYRKDTNELQCQVTDTGIGITDTQLKNVFQPFKQADSSTTRLYGGTGLGLSLSKRLATLMGGELNVSSHAGKGTRFTLTIPCGEINELVDSLEKIEFADKQEFTHVNNLQGNILLAEDNITNQKLISALLRKTGASVTTADNGAEAVELALNNQYDIIYMDMQMPVMSGLEAVKILRGENYHGAIIALTANATREDRSLCLDSGCTDYLTKPVNRDSLYRITAQFLSEAKDSTPEDFSMQAIYTELSGNELIPDELLTEFMDELAKILMHIKMAFINSEWSSMSASLHDLKGMGGGFGYPQLSTLAENLEQKIKKENYTDVQTLLNELQNMCQRIQLGQRPDSACA